MTRRSGLTMTEVLVALFIMALGTIAILTLFPLGMLNMSRALQDDRTSQAASSADGVMRNYWKMYVVENQYDTTLIGAFDNPGTISPSTLPALTAANASEPSYPVFVDPIGRTSQGAPNFAGGTYLTGTPRVNMWLVSNAPVASQRAFALRMCTMMDGITYGMNGNADITSTPNVERDMLYSWLWVLQRPRNGDTSTATMQVVVFIKRSPDYYPPNAEQPFTATMTPNTTSLTLPLTSGLSKGSWIMDAGDVNNNLRQANFYRVSSVTDTGSNLTVELESPIRRIDGSGTAYTGNILTMASVVDVFQRPNLTP